MNFYVKPSSIDSERQGDLCALGYLLFLQHLGDVEFSAKLNNRS